ncbi:uncharacterized protein LOC122944127 [Bufo gargarizans]|uniref:uncharacterized protein LOC122944127 n=1 Tax=Bufo gargarizans TaxID=30331 RepID=UPI001CF5DFCD|nr:uncharacterized protein LOC122944127 [Bufo gargarizans]
MHQNIESKKGRLDRRTSKRVTVKVPSREAAAGTRVPSVIPRLCQTADQSPALSPSHQSDCNGNRGICKDTSLQKISANARCPDNALTESVALPLIKKGAGKVTALSVRNTDKRTDLLPSLKASYTRGKQKTQPILSSDMTPWVRASPSETSLTCLLQSIPSPKTLSDNMADSRQSQREAANEDGWSLKASAPEQPTLKDKANGRAKPRGRTGVTKRRASNKFHHYEITPGPRSNRAQLQPQFQLFIL